MFSATSGNPNEQDVEENSKTLQMEFLRAALPACQPQEASPASTFTSGELEELRNAISAQIRPHTPTTTLIPPNKTGTRNKNNKSNQIDIIRDSQFAAPKQVKDSGNSQEEDSQVTIISWHGAPKIALSLPTQDFRRSVRTGQFVGTTNGVCPGFLQCNLVVLPQGQYAFDFLLFCQRNKKACPLIEVCNVGSPCPEGVARGADLRTDIPK
jgi:hypothetical protein